MTVDCMRFGSVVQIECDVGECRVEVGFLDQNSDS
jgi:hypothetical protein